MEVNNSFQLSIIEEEIADLLKAGEIKRIENLLFNYFDYLSEWKLHSKILELSEIAINQCSFFKCSNFYLACLAFEQQKFEKCQGLIKIFINDHKNSMEQVKNSLGEKRFIVFREMVSGLHNLGIQEGIFFLKQVNIKEINRSKFIESLILSENKLLILTKAIELLNENAVGDLLAILSIDKSDPKIKNWIKQRNAEVPLDNIFDTAIEFEQDVNLVEKILLMSGLDTSTQSQDENNDRKQPRSDPNENMTNCDDSELFHNFFFGRKLPEIEVNIFERDWDYQLAHELHLNNEYYLCLLVLEFIKTTKPLGNADLKMVLHLEQSCSEQLKMPLRVERLKQELLKIN